MRVITAQQARLLRADIEDAARQFATYAVNHHAKGTTESTVKAKVNEVMHRKMVGCSAVISEALMRAPTPLPPAPPAQPAATPPTAYRPTPEHEIRLMRNELSWMQGVATSRAKYSSDPDCRKHWANVAAHAAETMATVARVIPESWTVWVQSADRTGTVWVDCIEAKDVEQAKLDALNQCAAAWSDHDGGTTYKMDDLHIVGVAVGNVHLIEWNDAD
jgi:hypothetical protein